MVQQKERNPGVGQQQLGPATILGVVESDARVDGGATRCRSVCGRRWLRFGALTFAERN
jgi:hypothetical protein